MGRETVSLVQSLVVFVIISFFVIVGIFWLMNRGVEKIKMGSKMSKWQRFLRMLAGCGWQEILSLSLLTTRQFYFVWCLFQSSVSLTCLLILIAPGFIYNIINKRFVNLFVDLANCILLYAALWSKNVFYAYIINIAGLWHVILFLILLVVFSLLYSLFFYFKNVENILERNTKKIYNMRKK